VPITILPWSTTFLGLVPLAWLSGMQISGHRRGAEWWWLAAAFGVSFVADVVAYFLAPPARWVTIVTYPVSQAALVSFVFLTRRDTRIFLGTLLVVGVIAVLWRGVRGPDILLATVAFGGVAGIVIDRWALGHLRTALLVYFGVGLVAWWCFAARPGLWSWSVYQCTRAAGIGLFCYAATRPNPGLVLR
jgi:hypothetical protein